MSKSVTINIRTDEKTRRELKKFAGKIGIPVSALINASIKQMIRSGQVTFSTNLEPSPYLKEIVNEALEDYKVGKNTHGPFDSADDMIAELEK